MSAIEYVPVIIAAVAMVARIALFLPRAGKPRLKLVA
jgi:hypothetical protein